MRRSALVVAASLLCACDAQEPASDDVDGAPIEDTSVRDSSIDTSAPGPRPDPDGLPPHPSADSSYEAPPRDGAGDPPGCPCPDSTSARGAACHCPSQRCTYPSRCDTVASDYLDCGGTTWELKTTVTCDDGHGGTTGLPCTEDSVCDVVGDGVNACSSSLYATGTLYPSPVCIGRDCDPGDGTKLATCDLGHGICLGIGSAGRCLPSCTFDDSGAPPVGCVTKNACVFYRAERDAAGRPLGRGVCFGGCRVDADCAKGDVCQTESRTCMKARVAFTKVLGDSCVRADDGTACVCAYTIAERSGYCTQACDMGGAACPAGFTCDASLPTKDAPTGAPLFTKVPLGLAGRCLKDCATNADCAAYGPSECKTNAGSTHATCQVLLSP